jgi:AsmA protein
MRNFKIVGGILGAIALLVCTALIAVALLVNPNNFKANIAAKIQQATGRGVQLRGDIKLSVFPRVSLELGSTTLGNPPGFADPVFLVFSHATLRVAVLPLLRHRLEVTRIEIDGLDLRLAKNAEGKGNWQWPDSNPPRDSSQGAARSAPESRLEALANLKIRSGRVSYASSVFQNLNLETGSLAADGHVPVTGTVDADRGRIGEGVSANVKFDLSEDAAGARILLSAINLSGTLARPGDGRPAHWDLAAPQIAVDLTRRTLAATAFTLSYANAHVAGNAVAVNLADDVSVTGSATLSPLVLQEIAPRLGILIPKTHDPRAFSQLSAAADFSYAANEWQLKNLQGRLDDSAFTGNLAFAAELKRLTFDFAVDRIDLNRYAAPETGAASPPAIVENQPAEKPESVDLHGTFKVQSAEIAHLNLTDLRFTVASHDEVIRVYPLEALIDGGRYSGDITVDHRRILPTVSMDEHLTGIDMTRLLADGALKGRISGRANLNLKGTARGSSAGSLLKSLNGEFNADLSDGYFEGTDLGYEFARAQALIERTPMAGREDTRRTKFDAVNLSGQIVNGVAESRDLLVSSPVLKVSGQGTANLATRALNVQLLASLLKSPGQSVVDVPFKITGTYVDPSVKADVEALAKGQLKQKLQDVLKKNGLEGLFGK